MNKGLILLCLLAVSFAVSTEHIGENNAADQLVREIQRMENAVRDEQHNHEELNNTQSAECITEIGFRNTEVENAKDALTNSQSSKGKCENAHTASEADKAKAEGYVSTIKDILTGLETQRNTEHDAYEHLINEELNPAIEAVNGVYPIIDSIEKSSTAASFAQLSAHLNKSFIQMIKANKVNQFGVILVQLLQASPAGISEETIDQLVKLFDDLLEDLTLEKEHAIQVEGEALQVYNTAVEEYGAIVQSLNETIASLVIYIGEMETCIQTEKSVSASAEAKETRNQEALDHAIEMCSAFQTEYENSTKARDDELALLSKLKTFVREQEDIFGNYGNDGVNAFEEYQKSFAETRAHSRANFLQVTLKQYNSATPAAPVASSNCKSCRKTFLQKKLGF